MLNSIGPGASRILVTGGNGFVGRRLVARLRAGLGENQSVQGLSGPANAAASSTGVDLSVPAEARHALAAFDPTVVVHLAAQSSVGTAGKDPAGVWRANFDATRNVAEAALALGHPVRLIFASTAEVYGRAFLNGPCGEDAAILPQSIYARSKAASEFLLQDLATDDLQVVVLRLFNHTGAGQDSRFVVPSFAAQLAALRATDDAVIRVGNLDAQRDFTDVDDIIEAYVQVIGQSVDAPFALFNVGSGVQRSIRSVLETLVRCHGRAVETLADPARQRPADIPVATGVFDRFRDTFGWTATTPFEETLAAVYGFERERAATDRPSTDI